ncbi:MAG: tetratricopeptide repeat protein [Anaerolineales bacterium]|nr:tetratricopeptide repeat protein [Anaerolineales bacterium]
MNTSILILTVGGAYIVLFGGLSLLRREGLSTRLAIEAILITALVSGLAALTGRQIHPVFFLLFLYLITMRVRILVDLGNTLAKKGRFSQAERLYQLAMHLWPDQTGKLIIQINEGTALLQQSRMDEAIQTFKNVLVKSNQDYLGVKYEVAAHYNLGVAYLRKNLDALATVEFNTVLDTWPASEFAQRATSALEQHRRRSKSASEKVDG